MEWATLGLALGAVVALAAWLQARRWRQRAEVAEGEVIRLRRERTTLTRRVGDLGQLLARLQDASHDLLLAVDARRRVIAMNEQATAVLGAAEGRTLIELVRDADLNGAVIETLADGRRRDVTVAVAGRMFHAQVVATGAVAAVALQDTTELHRLQRARRDFVANISHELRTPLTSIGLLCDALEATASSSESRSLVATISSEVGAMTRLVNDMLDLTQIEDGRLPLRLATCRAVDLIESAVSRLRPQAEQKAVAFAVKAAPELQVLADEDKMGRVLTNLLDNAIKYSAPHGLILVAAERFEVDGQPGGDVVFSVTDEGLGIPTGDLPRVFERFFKSDRARERSSRVGAGLGLAIARHLVEAHEGRIWVTSEEGQGATFYFTLPEA